MFVCNKMIALNYDDHSKASTVRFFRDAGLVHPVLASQWQGQGGGVANLILVTVEKVMTIKVRITRKITLWSSLQLLPVTFSATRLCKYFISLL